MTRRELLASVGSASAVGVLLPVDSGVVSAAAEARSGTEPQSQARKCGEYSGAQLDHLAFPMGGMGAGMICLEGSGALSHFSLRNRPDLGNEPCTFAAIAIKGSPTSARVLEGPLPDLKRFGRTGAGFGAPGSTFGLPRFAAARFHTRFPFGRVTLADKDVPLDVEITGWSPFEPGDADNASLPVVALEYRFTNNSTKKQDSVFSWNARNFIALDDHPQSVNATPGGFILWCGPGTNALHDEGAFSATVNDPAVRVNHAWFRGGWFDPLTMAWKDVVSAACFDRPPPTEGGASPGASLFVPFALEPGASNTIVLRLAWYVGKTEIRIGNDPRPMPEVGTYQPWYSGKFRNVEEVARYWADQYSDLRTKSQRFSDCLYDSTLPPEVIEAVAANLTILKSPTVLRQADGRLWAWEGSGDSSGSCHGSCTHVWNYAQAIPHLFPALERTLRETEFNVSQDDRGHQQFRSSLPIRPVKHDFHAAADGQLGGIMKVHREWRISGDTGWLKSLWPRVKASLDYCINTWDPVTRAR